MQYGNSISIIGAKLVYLNFIESEEQTKRNTEYSFKKYSFKKKYKGFFKSFENMPVRKIEN